MSVYTYDVPLHTECARYIRTTATVYLLYQYKSTNTDSNAPASTGDFWDKFKPYTTASYRVKYSKAVSTTHVSSYSYICVLILTTYVSSYCCTTASYRVKYSKAVSTTHVSSYSYICVICVFIRATHVSSYCDTHCYICVLILVVLHMFPHTAATTTIYVSSG
jgi:hypothetical protein